MMHFIMKKQRSILLLTLLATGLFVPSTTCGQSKKILAVYTEWFPYTFQENGKASGFEIEIVEAVMKNMNKELEFRRYPWKRCLGSLKNGEVDLLVSLLKTEEREKFTYYPDNHISISRTVFFTGAGRSIEFNGSYEKLKGYRIGVIAGFSYGDAFDNAKYLTKDPVKYAKSLIRKVHYGRNDLGAENQAVISAYARKMEVLDNIRFLEPPIHTLKLYVGFSRAKGLKKLNADFSTSPGEFKSSEAYKKILRKYEIGYTEMTK